MGLTTPQHDPFTEPEWIRSTPFQANPHMTWEQDIQNGYVRITNHTTNTVLTMSFTEWQTFVVEIPTIRSRAFVAKVHHG